MEDAQVLSVCRPAPTGDRTIIALFVLAFLLTPLAEHPLFAQGLRSEEAVDAIVGSDVQTEEASQDKEHGRLLAAIEKTSDSAVRVRKAVSLETLEIVFVPDLKNGTGAVEQAIAQREAEMKELRESIEGNAMLYHAIDSRQILLQNVLAVEFSAGESVTIFVNGKEQ